MRFLIIGLGIYGENLARDLTDMGHEVIGADRNPAHVEGLKDVISTVYTIDSTEESQLSVLPLRNVDLVIVAIGENFGASIKTVALLKKAKVKHIYARAIDTLHEAIMHSFEIDRILTPEQRAAADLSHELELGTSVLTLPVDADHVVIKFIAPDFLTGIDYLTLKQRLENDYNANLVAATRLREGTNIMGISHPEPRLIETDSEPAPTVERGDVLTVFGSRKNLRQLYRHIGEG